MKKIVLILFFGILSITVNAQHTQTYTSNLSISPENGQGLEGSVTVFYAFANCFSDAVIAYGFNNLNISAYHYNGKRYTEADLGVDFSSSQYVQTTSLSKINARITLNGRFVNNITLSTILPKFDTGCYGQTKKVGSSKENGIDGWQVTFSNVKVTAKFNLVTKIKNLEKQAENKKKIENLISQANKAQTDQQKLDILNKAKLYANDNQKSQLENQLQDLKNKIAQEKQQQTTTLNEQNNKSSDTDYWGEKKSSTNNNSSNNDNTQVTETKGQKAAREYKEWTEEQDKQRKQTLNGNNTSTENSYYVNAVSSATLSSLNGDYKAATQQYTQLAVNGISSGNNRNAIVGTTGALLSAWQNASNQRRQRELDYQRRKEAFDNQASKYRREVNKIINARKTFVNQPKSKSLINEDGTSFKPIYIYFAYVEKGYDYSKDNIEFPDQMKIDFNETSKVQFSQVFAFFPYSNGEYPLISDMKKKILNEYFRNKSNDYEIFFFPWERSVNDIVSSLQQNMNKAVSKHYFANAIPSNKNEIEFLISKTSASQTKDYWTGEKVKKKETKKTDYWKN